MKLRDRPTSDLVVVLLAGIVGFVVLVATIGGIVWVIVDPEGADLSELGIRVADMTNTLIGVIVGYMAGKGTGAVVAHREDRERGGGDTHETPSPRG